MTRVAFFGVGLMGEPMAAHLLDAGHGVAVVAHRSRAGVERLVGKGAVEGSTALEAVERTEIAIMMLPTADEVEEVLFGAGGAARAMAPGYTVIDMGTSFPPQTRRLAARVAERGGRFLDAPVTGGTKGARDGTLTIMVGGDAETFERVKPVLRQHTASQPPVFGTQLVPRQGVLRIALGVADGGGPLAAILQLDDGPRWPLAWKVLLQLWITDMRDALHQRPHAWGGDHVRRKLRQRSASAEQRHGRAERHAELRIDYGTRRVFDLGRFANNGRVPLACG